MVPDRAEPPPGVPLRHQIHPHHYRQMVDDVHFLQADEVDIVG
jgi:hypothetical protein